MDYRDYARATAIRYGLDPEIVLRQIEAESGWNPKARSPAGALGISQFMPDTAKRFGVDPLDPVSAIDGQMRYMRKLLDEFGSYELALAGYNAGEGAVRKHGGVPPYKETQGYVRKILGSDVRMASSDIETPPEMQVPGDPMTGYADFQMPPQAGAGMPSLPPERPSFSDAFFNNPWIQFGMAIMSNPSANAMQSIGQGFGAMQQMRMLQQGKELYARQLQQKDVELLGLDQMSPWQRYQVDLARGRQTLDQRILEQKIREFENPSADLGQPSPGALYYPETDKFVSVPNTKDPALYQNPDVQSGKATVVGLPPGSSVGKKEGSSLKAEDRIRGLETRIAYLDETIAEVDREPWTTSMFAPVRKFAGGAAESVAAELDKFGIGSSLSGSLRSFSRASGAEAVAGMDFRMATAASMAARDIINYGDPRMSDTDRRAADEILARAGTFKDPVTAKRALVELRDYQKMQLARDGANYGLRGASAGGATTPAEMGAVEQPPEQTGAVPVTEGTPVLQPDGTWTLNGRPIRVVR